MDLSWVQGNRPCRVRLFPLHALSILTGMCFRARFLTGRSVILKILCLKWRKLGIQKKPWLCIMLAKAGSVRAAGRPVMPIRPLMAISWGFFRSGSAFLSLRDHPFVDVNKGMIFDCAYCKDSQERGCLQGHLVFSLPPCFYRIPSRNWIMKERNE